MEVEAIVTYVVSDDTIKFLGITEDKQTKMGMAEIMTTAIISTIQFSGNIEKDRKALKATVYFPNMLSKSQFNRRLLRIDKTVWNAALEALTREFEKMGCSMNLLLTAFLFLLVSWQGRIDARFTKAKNTWVTVQLKKSSS